MGEKSKTWLTDGPKDVLIVIIFVLACSACFGLGILAGQDVGQGTNAFSISQIPQSASPLGTAIAPVSLPAGGQVVASKNGTKYFLPWCGGASQINDANKIWFATKEEAEAKGYQPAGNCKGL